MWPVVMPIMCHHQLMLWHDNARVLESLHTIHIWRCMFGTLWNNVHNCVIHYPWNKVYETVDDDECCVVYWSTCSGASCVLMGVMQGPLICACSTGLVSGKVTRTCGSGDDMKSLTVCSGSPPSHGSRIMKEVWALLTGYFPWRPFPPALRHPPSSL